MTALGLRLFDYLPDRAWLAEMRDSTSAAGLARYGISGIFPMPATYRIAGRLQTNADEIIHDQDQVISINYFGSLSEEEIKQDIMETGATIVPEKIQPPRTLFVRVNNASILQKLAALPYVSYIAPQPMKAR